MNADDTRPPINPWDKPAIVGLFILGNVFLFVGAYTLWLSAREGSIQEAVVSGGIAALMGSIGIYCAGVSIRDLLLIRLQQKYPMNPEASIAYQRDNRRRLVTQWLFRLVVVVVWAGVVYARLPAEGWKALAPLPPTDRTQELKDLRARIESLRELERMFQIALEKEREAQQAAKDRSGPFDSPPVHNTRLADRQKQLTETKSALRDAEAKLAAMEKTQPNVK